MRRIIARAILIGAAGAVLAIFEWGFVSVGYWWVPPVLVAVIVAVAWAISTADWP